MKVNFKNLFWIFLFFPLFVLAETQDIELIPSVINEKAKAKDLLEFSAKIINHSNATLRLYPLVKDISDKQELDKSVSLASWIEIPRGRIEILPKEEKEILFSVKVSLSAKAGIYSAQIIFSQGATMPEAEANALKFNQPTILLNIEVQENTVEKAQLKKFQTKNNVYFKNPIEFLLEIENIGNVEIFPQGNILIYNRLGQEIEAIPINQEKEGIGIGATKTFNFTWRSKGFFGQYKAMVALDYGKIKEKDLKDTVYFWFFSWQILIGIFFFLAILISVLIFVLFKKLKHPESNKVLDIKKFS